MERSLAATACLANAERAMQWGVRVLLELNRNTRHWDTLRCNHVSHVILSGAKNLTARPFTAFRVTILVCQSDVV